jgi:hypothetical protein
LLAAPAVAAVTAHHRRAASLGTNRME